MAESTGLPQDRKGYSAAEKRRILQELDEERRRAQRTGEEIRRYLSDKKTYNYHGDLYYKVSDYKQSFYILKSILDTMGNTIQEIELERSGYTTNRKMKGFIKWDNMRGSFLISTSKVRVYYKPFEVEA